MWLKSRPISSPLPRQRSPRCGWVSPTPLGVPGRRKQRGFTDVVMGLQVFVHWVSSTSPEKEPERAEIRVYSTMCGFLVVVVVVVVLGSFGVWGLLAGCRRGIPCLPCRAPGSNPPTRKMRVIF